MGGLWAEHSQQKPELSVLLGLQPPDEAASSCESSGRTAGVVLLPRTGLDSQQPPNQPWPHPSLSALRGIEVLTLWVPRKGTRKGTAPTTLNHSTRFPSPMPAKKHMDWQATSSPPHAMLHGPCSFSPGGRARWQSCGLETGDPQSPVAVTCRRLQAHGSSECGASGQPLTEPGVPVPGPRGPTPAPQMGQQELLGMRLQDWMCHPWTLRTEHWAAGFGRGAQ